VAAFTRSTALEAGPGVTANYVSPSLIATNQTVNDPSPVRKAIFEMCMGRQCVKRSGLAIDVARTICWIAGPETEFITGQGFDVGGGTVVSDQSRAMWSLFSPRK
jgi:3-oxoacyl-[acyl-carrier protein] reductase